MTDLEMDRLADVVANADLERSLREINRLKGLNAELLDTVRKVGKCGRCGGHGAVPLGCPDPQCDDSTWDHNCELGKKGPCPECDGTGVHPDARAAIVAAEGKDHDVSPASRLERHLKVDNMLLREAAPRMTDEEQAALPGWLHERRERQRKRGAYWLSPEGRTELRETFEDPDDGCAVRPLLNALEASERSEVRLLEVLNRVRAFARDWPRPLLEQVDCALLPPSEAEPGEGPEEANPKQRLMLLAHGVPCKTCGGSGKIWDERVPGATPIDLIPKRCPDCLGVT